MGDDISRKDAIKHFQDLSKQIESMPITDIITRLKDMPPVTLQPRKGHWVMHNTPSNTCYYDCSRCGCAAPCTEFADSYIWKLSNFCPDCGADMRGEK